MASSDVPSWQGTGGGRKITESLGSRQEFVKGATAGGLLRGVAVAAILSRVLGSRSAPRRR